MLQQDAVAAARKGSAMRVGENGDGIVCVWGVFMRVVVLYRGGERFGTLQR